MRLCQEVAALGGRPTRLDVAADDYRKRVLPSQVNAVAKSGDIARFRTQTCAFHEGGYFEGAIGETFTAGRRGADGSGAYLRYYRKDVESRGRINAFRWEVEFSDEKAQLAFTELLKAQTLDEFTLAGAYLVIGSVDFPMRNGGDEAHLERLERHAFWVDITSDFFNCTLLKVKRATSTLERKAAHVRERCGSLLKAVMAMFQMTRPSDRAGRRAFYAALGQWVDLAKPSAASREAVAAYAFVNKLSPPAWVNLAPRVT
jgi:DNA relaxase NicK